MEKPIRQRDWRQLYYVSTLQIWLISFGVRVWQFIYRVQTLKHSATTSSAMTWILSWRVPLPLNKAMVLECEMAMVRLRLAFLLLPSATFLLLPWVLSCNGEEDVGWELEDEIRKNNSLWLTNVDVNKRIVFYDMNHQHPHLCILFGVVFIK